MIITYLRSSSYSQWDMCPFAYYMQYTLGWRTPSGKAADIGSISHKAMEFLAQQKKCIQSGKTSFYDEETKKEYAFDERIENLIEEAWNHYVKGPASHHQWKAADKKQVYKNVYDFTHHNNGMYNPLNMNIIECEQFFDIEIKEDWAKYEYEDDKGNKIKGNLAIKGTMDLLTHHDESVMEYVDWKGLPIDTPIPTPNGWTTMGNLVIGSKVFDKDGNIVNVIGKSDIKFKKCFKITFDDTSDIICDNEHLWLLSDSRTVPVTELKILDKIDIAKPLILEDEDLPIDPYVLGLWLGDGKNRGGEISKNDDFIFEEIQKRGYKIGKNIGGKDRCNSQTVYELTKELKKLNLLHNKHIPEIYLRSSFSQRLDLLRGLMDSDGSVNSIRKQAVFTSCNKKLSDDTKELLLTLGQRPYQAKTKQKGFGLIVDAYPISFRPININPFLLPRKSNQIKDWGYGKSNIRTIKKIEEIEEKYTQCIMVDSPTNTYLCSKNMIPTHNTGRKFDWAKDKEKDYDDLEKDFQVRLYHYALCHLFPQYKVYLMTFFYNNDGGPFHMALENGDFDFVKKKLKNRFNEIKNCKKPKRNLSWKCSKLCHFGKTLNKDSKFYRGLDNGKTICDTIHEELIQVGLDRLTNKFGGIGKADSYMGGGGRSNRDEK